MNQDTGLKRDVTDKFYTNKTTVNICYDKILENVDIQTDDIIIEPSAGNGSFIDKIKQFKAKLLFYDIRPEHDEVVQQDFLKLNYSKLQAGKIHIIGNPPFGRQSNLAIKFIKYSCMFCDSISFILPKSFKKDSMKKHFHIKFHNIVDIDLPKNSFTINGKDYNVPCVFQIWVKNIENRPIEQKIEPNGYIFVKKTDNPDISIRRVGVYAGKIDREIETKNIQSHYFIKFDQEVSDDMIRDLDLKSANYTVGPKSISKSEITKELNFRFSGSLI